MQIVSQELQTYRTQQETVRSHFMPFISALILAHVESGKTLEEAMDFVLGEGVYADLVSDLYDDLRKGLV